MKIINYMKVFLFIILTTSPAISDTAAERLKLANELAEFTIENMDIGAAVVRIAMPQIIESLEVSGKTVTTAQKEKISTFLKEIYVPKMKEFLLNQAPFVAETFTSDEIRALIANKPLKDLDKTEEGRSIMKKMPLLHERQRLLVQEIANDTRDTLMQKIHKIIEQ